MVYLKLNELYSHHTWDYNGSYVTYETGYSAANWYSPSGWYLYWGPRFYYGPNSLPATSDYAKADAGYRNDVFPGGPYTDALLIKTNVYGSGSGNASYSFGVDPKGVALGFHWWGSYSRTQLY